MKSVSNDYKKSMKGVFRAQSYAEITLKLSTGAVVFGLNDIISVTRTNDVDPISRRLPIETLEFDIIDFEGNYDFTSPNYSILENDTNAELTVRFGYKVNGNIEWIAPEKYYLSGKPKHENKTAKFYCVKRLSLLNKKFYKGVFTDTSYTYKALAIAVLTDAGLSENEYDIDSTLGYYNSSAPLPIDYHKNILQMIAHATGCALYTSGIGRITIKKISLSSNPLDFELTQRDVSSGSEKITKIDSIQKSDSYTYNYHETNSYQGVVYDESTTLDYPMQYHIEFPMSKNVLITVNGMEVNADIYAQSADFYVPFVGSVNILAKGYQVNASKVVFTEVVNNNESLPVCTSDNPTVTDHSVSAILAANTALYLGYKNTTSFQYRGNPELECLDIIKYKNQFSEEKKCLVLRSVLKYQGAFSGELTLKFID